MSVSTIGVGFIPGPSDEATRQAGRARLKDCAADEGIALVDTYAPSNANAGDSDTWIGVLADLASLHTARTILVFGAVDARLMSMIRQAELRLICVPAGRDGRHRARSDSRPTWIGMLELDRMNRDGLRVDIVHLDVQTEVITMSLAGRILARCVRTRLRAWLRHPTGTLTVGDVCWSVSYGVTCLAVEDGPALSIPTSTLDYLRTVI